LGGDRRERIRREKGKEDAKKKHPFTAMPSPYQIKL
jgi:hypothetical protein